MTLHHLFGSSWKQGACENCFVKKLFLRSSTYYFERKNYKNEGLDTVEEKMNRESFEMDGRPPSEQVKLFSTLTKISLCHDFPYLGTSMKFF